jgi:hypothetical protein
MTHHWCRGALSVKWFKKRWNGVSWNGDTLIAGWFLKGKSF